MKNPAVPLLLLGGLLLASTAAGRADDKRQSLFCTMRLGGGGSDIYTIYLRVPARTSGECQVANVSEAEISGPPPFDTPVATPPPSRNNGSNPGFILSGPVHANDTQTFMLLNGTSLPDLGTLTTAKGTAYDGCRLLTFQKDAVIVVRTEGVMKLIFADLDADSLARVKAVQSLR